MKKYCVRFSDTLIEECYVEAENEEQAIEIALGVKDKEVYALNDWELNDIQEIDDNFDGE